MDYQQGRSKGNTGPGATAAPSTGFGFGASNTSTGAFGQPQQQSTGFIPTSNTPNTGPQIGGWAINGVRTDPVVEGNRGAGGTMTAFEPNGLPAGTYSWSLQVFLPPGDGPGNTAVITGTPTYPNVGTVQEI